MKPPKTRSVTPMQWLAVAAIWGLVGYATLAAPKAEAGWGPAHLIACR